MKGQLRGSTEQKLSLYRLIEGVSLVAQTVKILPAVQETQAQYRVRKIPWRREWLPTPVAKALAILIKKKKGINNQ